MKLTLRRQRLKLVWILVVPFLYLARPTPTVLICGAALAVSGAAMRAWAAGSIRKNRDLSVAGPYAFTRNPLYLGSFFIGLGFTVAGGQWLFVVAFLLFFSWIYVKTMRAEARSLEDLFGDTYREYRAEVPVFLPRLTPYRPGRGEVNAPPPADARGSVSEAVRNEGGFSFAQYVGNREWEAALGIVAGFAFLVIKMMWFS
jgi:hypothetical protein